MLLDTMQNSYSFGHQRTSHHVGFDYAGETNLDGEELGDGRTRLIAFLFKI